MHRLAAILRQRCPVCLEGKVFSGLFRMKEHCDDCGLVFEREPGYFLGAMYFSYPAACGLIALFAFLVSALFPRWEAWQVVLAACLPLTFFVPLLFRYSRILWMHLDRYFVPEESPGERRVRGFRPARKPGPPEAGEERPPGDKLG
jgi:uncharacterized protein (DUF983 family)